MSLISRRTGIIGIASGAVLCLICGVPFIAALLGLSSISATTIFSDVSIWLKIVVTTVSLLILALLIVRISRKRSKHAQETEL